MNDTEVEKNDSRTFRKVLVLSFVGVVCICVLGIISLKVYLGTPYASSLLSRTLTSYLHQPVRVAGLHITGGSIYLTGVSLGNPSDVPPGNLAEVASIIIAPNWGDLLRGRRRLRLIAFEGPKLFLLKSGTGVWNFSRLQSLFSAGKPAGSELLIERFVVKDGVFQVNGQGAKGISLQLFNLATKGSGDAKIKLSFEDAARNNYTVTGIARPGPKPVLDLTLAAPALSLNRLAEMLKLKNSPFYGESNGSLRVTATLHDGLLRAAGRLDSGRFLPTIPGKSFPLNGSVTFAVAYDLGTDEARLESLSVVAGNLMRGYASGTIARVRSERRFAVDIGIDGMDLAALAFLLPEGERRKTELGGTLQRTEFHVSGTGRQGLTDATGALVLKGCYLRRNGKLFFKALSSQAGIFRVSDGFLVKGRLYQGGNRGSALLGDLQAPFEMMLSQRLKLIRGGVPSLAADVMGVAVTGRLGYRAASSDPFTFALQSLRANFSSLHQLPGKQDLQITSGSGSFAVEGSGRGARDFTATATARVSNMRGARGGTHFGIKDGAVDS
ncbi:MAG: hypothetical protein PHR66_13835, partial [Desulfuromonadaceae bacterium]|nr:hypothetical protein [Desulfuromonadaceae bacterium]